MFSTGYETELTAQELASTLVRIHNREVQEEYLPVTLVSPNKPTLVVEVKLDSTVPLANRGEVLHCITRDGKKVDFLILSPPQDRADGFLTAIALVEDGI
jgi:hypothetical protein